MTRQEMYQETYSNLEDGVNISVFFKKDGTLRMMLSTRDLITRTICLEDNLNAKLQAHTQRSNYKNGNIAVVDLLIEDVRAFSIDRLVKNIYLGDCDSKKDLDKYANMFNWLVKYVNQVDTKIGIDNIDVEERIKAHLEPITATYIEQALAETQEETQEEGDLGFENGGASLC